MRYTRTQDEGTHGYVEGNAECCLLVE